MPTSGQRLYARLGTHVQLPVWHGYSERDAGHHQPYHKRGAEWLSGLACTIGTTLTVGQNYTLSVRTNASADKTVRVWLDLNNDGTLNPTTELIFSSNSARQHTGTISLPASTVLGTRLRLRVASDWVNVAVPTPCSTPQYSQTEDYAVTAVANTVAPVAEFVADQTLTCSGCAQFTDQSQNAPTSWLWNFGDNTTSTLQNPTHQYATAGTFNVRLTATNVFGTSVVTRNNYVTLMQPCVAYCAATGTTPNIWLTNVPAPPTSGR